MKTIKVSGATGVVLDWMVAKCEGVNAEAFRLYYDPTETSDLDSHGYPEFHYSTTWAQGGPIFSEAKISASIDDSGVWIAWCQYNYADEKRFMQSGHTELVAKARCYVAMNLGLAVEVPEDL